MVIHAWLFLLLLIDCIINITDRKINGKNQWVTVTCGYKLFRKEFQDMETGRIFIHKKDSEFGIKLETEEQNTYDLKIRSLTNAKVQMRYPISAVKQDADCMIGRKQY